MWKSILFIQNYDKYTDMVGSYYSNARLNCSNDSWLYQCADQTWYLSVDLQLSILAYLGLILLANRPKLGLLYSALFVILGMVIPGIQLVNYNIKPPIIMVKNEGLYELKWWVIIVTINASNR